MNKKMSIPKLIVILGPTASGKSDLAVRLAKKINGEIISADSRQVYKCLDIGSGKVPKDNSKFKIQNSKLQSKNQNYFYKGIRHYLLDVANPKRTFTVTQYQKIAKKALADIIKRGKIPIICGGTGLYIDALIYDYKFPQVPLQPKLRKELEKKTAEKLYKQLKKLDPRRAKNIDKNNRRRLIRALEIILTTKKPVPPLTSLRGSDNYEVLKIGIKKTSQELKKLIKKRLLKRIEQGMINEVKNLRNPPAGGGLSWQRLDDLGLEYRYVSRYLRGLISKKEMVESLEKEIYRYAKRQMTWFKRDKNITWIDNPKKADTICRDWLGL
jgi:tRNA dimethylallyltransferase